MNIDIQPIETAPKDGTPILTNEGWVMWDVNNRAPSGEWVCCDPNGYIFYDDQNVNRAYPRQWTPTKIFN